MLEAVLMHLNNWFPAGGGKHAGTFAARHGALCAPFLLPGQYYRIRGSVLNDGLHRQGDNDLHRETFTGEVWALAIPREVIALSQQIEAWCAQHPESDLVSERFGDYSYTRAGASGGWQSAFAARLAPYRRVYDD